nr:hypothetical protein [Tanacetum cinerariifolium]
MDLSKQVKSVDSSGGGESSGFGPDMISNKMSLEKPTLAFSGDERYLTPLWVSRKADELYEIDPSQDGSELSAGKHDQYKQISHDKMEAVLKKITFREQHVLVQFWSPRVAGKHRLLTTIDQPFGLGVVNEGLYM